MIIQRLSEKQLKAYWRRRLPDQEILINRLYRFGLTPRDFNLTDLEIICACSLMADRRTVHDVHQAIDGFRSESTERRFEADFFDEMQKTISEMERKGMRTHALRLRKIGQGIADSVNELAWRSHWGVEADNQRSSAIKDEPFLPQRG